MFELCNTTIGIVGEQTVFPSEVEVFPDGKPAAWDECANVQGVLDVWW
jgi:hypothetical protein